MSESESGSDTEVQNGRGATKSVEEALEALSIGAEEAKRTDDYIGYSTLIDIILDKRDKYSEQDNVLLLLKLYDILCEDSELCYSVAWDLPQILLPFLECPPRVNFNDYSTRKEQTCRRVAGQLFNLIADRGNPKEVFLKTTEAMASLDLYSESTEQEATGNDPFIGDRTCALKFCSLLCVTVRVLRRIKTRYPSRFISAFCTTVLSFTSSISVRMILQCHRLVLRKSLLTVIPSLEDLDEADIEPGESSKCRRILQSYITYLAEFGFQKMRISWDKRYFTLIRPKLGLPPAPQNEIDDLLEGFDRSIIVELLGQFIECARTLDMTRAEIIHFLLKCNAREGCSSCLMAAEKFSGLSKRGLMILLAHSTFLDRPEDLKISFRDLCRVMTEVMSGETPAKTNLALEDAIVFLSEYLCVRYSAKEIGSVAPDDFRQYIQRLDLLSVSSSVPDCAPIVHRLVSYLLNQRLVSYYEEEKKEDQDRKKLEEQLVVYNYIKDVLTHCPYANLQSAYVSDLKGLFAAPTTGGSLAYTPERQEDLQILIDELFNYSESTTSRNDDEGIDKHQFDHAERAILALGYLNFLTIIGSDDKEFLRRVRDNTKQLIDDLSSTPNGNDKSINEPEDNVPHLLNLALESLCTKHEL